MGYRRVPRRDSVPAHVVLDEEKAALVRKIFHWHAHEKITIRQIACKITLSGLVPPRGDKVWGETTVHRRCIGFCAVRPMWGRCTTIGPRGFRPTERQGGDLSYPDKTQARLDRGLDSPDHRPGDVRSVSGAPRTESSVQPRRLKEEHWLLRRLLRCGRCGRKHSCVTVPSEVVGGEFIRYG